MRAGHVLPFGASMVVYGTDFAKIRQRGPSIFPSLAVGRPAAQFARFVFQATHSYPLSPGNIVSITLFCTHLPLPERSRQRETEGAAAMPSISEQEAPPPTMAKRPPSLLAWPLSLVQTPIRLLCDPKTGAMGRTQHSITLSDPLSATANNARSLSRHSISRSFIVVRLRDLVTVTGCRGCFMPKAEHNQWGSSWQPVIVLSLGDFDITS